MANIGISGLPGFTALAPLNEKTEPYLSARNNSSISIIPHVTGSRTGGYGGPVSTDGVDVDGSTCSRGCGDNCTECYHECATAFARCKAEGKEDIGDCKSEGNDCRYTCCYGEPP